MANTGKLFANDEVELPNQASNDHDGIEDDPIPARKGWDRVRQHVTQDMDAEDEGPARNFLEVVRQATTVEKRLREQREQKEQTQSKPRGHSLFLIQDALQALDNIDEKRYAVTDFYRVKGPIVRLCTHPYFENLTFLVIAMNVLYMGFDVEYNGADLISDAHVFFQICDSMFTIYFSIEIGIRFLSFADKRSCLRDNWFRFDSLLVSLMVMETWLLPILAQEANLPFNIQFLRFLRLLRLARMARLLKGLPELLYLVKATGSAVRSVSTVMTMLLMMVYLFAIVMRMMIGNIPGKMTASYGTIGRAMATLFYQGTLGDEISHAWKDIREVSEEDPDERVRVYFVQSVFGLYVFLTMFTVVNMLIGVLVNVILSVASNIKEELKIEHVRETMLKFLEEFDTDGNRTIGQDEFLHMVVDPAAIKALNELEVDLESFMKTTILMFEEGDGNGNPREIPFSDFMKHIIEMRKVNAARVYDVNNMGKSMTREMSTLQESIDSLSTEVQKALAIKEVTQETRLLKKRRTLPVEGFSASPGMENVPLPPVSPPGSNFVERNLSMLDMKICAVEGRLGMFGTQFNRVEEKLDQLLGKGGRRRTDDDNSVTAPSA
jgi:hypothetical protein